MYKIYLLKRYDNEAHKYVNHEEGNDDNIDNIKYGHVWTSISYTRTLSLVT